MKKYEHAFGKNDIRGIYGEDITEVEHLSRLHLFAF